ncbi:MAG: efflux RND transporter periplasmic adaptor subunit [Verrucomicrobiota bacterium]
MSPEIPSRFKFLLPILIIVGGGLIVWWLFASSPEQTTSPTLPPDPVVEAMPIQLSTEPIEIVGFGNIIPAREVHLAPEVSGRVIEVGKVVEPGGLAPEGTLLFRIDPRDYELAGEEALATLQRAEADLALEEGRSLVARAEWERFRSAEMEADEDSEPSALALREPQLRQAKAAVASARTALAQAKLNLERTTIRSPFDATILAESLEIGQRVSDSDTVVHLAGTQTFWVEISIPAAQLLRLSNLEDAAAEVALTTSSNGKSKREGRFVRVLPGLDPQGRMGRALIAVDNPLDVSQGRDLLPLDGYAEVTIAAGNLNEVMRAPRESVRENNQVWVRDISGLLRFREVDVLWRGDTDVLMRGTFSEGDQLITSYLNEPLPGQKIAVRDPL